MVFDQEVHHSSQWSAIQSIASKIGCTSETLRKWVRQAERDAGRRPGLTERREGHGLLGAPAAEVQTSKADDRCARA